MKLILLIPAAAAIAYSAEEPWARHVIDHSSSGADGVRLADINGDGLPDITTGWEEGGVVRAYINPGPLKALEKWPAVTVGKVKSVEDAVAADLDGDGAMDVVSAAEGKTRAIHFHWAPKDSEKYLDPEAWKTEALPAADGRRWMFTLPMQVDGRHGTDIIAGSKQGGAALGWFEAPEDARKVADWKFHQLRSASWIMSLVPSDMDGDGDQDIVITDRTSKRNGAFWLENPGHGPKQTEPWKEHLIGGAENEAMFLHLADLDGDGLEDVLVSVKSRKILFLRRLDKDGTKWETHTIECPENTGTAKAVNAADLDLDGKMDLIFSCEKASPPLHGVMRLSNPNPLDDSGWTAHPVSGPEGTKFDLIALSDLDGDGDLDAITTEEVNSLGLVWYANPARSPALTK